ncbi:hypothetical protein GY12_26685 [Micrococcus luteus]|nr:hypothetical protein GY12_26685 [Micrococcus luteus]
MLALAFSLYPIIAGGIPIGILQGIDYDLLTGQVHSMGTESILGMPLQTAGTILVGFLLFGTVLQHTGGAISSTTCRWPSSGATAEVRRRWPWHPPPPWA